MVFQGEEVSLEEDILKTARREFFPTKGEWVADKKEQIVKGAVSITGVATILTVPKNKTLFITSASLHLRYDGIGAGITAELRVRGTLRPNLLAIGVFHQLPYDSSVSNTFPMPIKVNEGEVVEVKGGQVAPSALSIATGSISGWLEDKFIGGQAIS